MRHAWTNHRTSLATIASWAMFSRGLEPEFPDAVAKQLAHLRRVVPLHDSELVDLTHLPWCSIDNDDSRDLDQLTAIETMDPQKVRVYVAVADVDAWVKKGSPVDEHAQHNTTSVYTSARVFTMLPERLCTDLTSLNPDQERWAIVVDMVFSDDGVGLGGSIYRAKVSNKAQLAYDAVSAWLEGKGPLPKEAERLPGLDLQLRLQDELAQKLRVLRRASGSLEFETFQPHAIFAAERIVDIQQQSHNRARQLIEELMIAANHTTACFLAAQGRSSLRRVVRSPERWLRIVDVARGYGVKLPHRPDGLALEAFLAQQHRADPLRFPDLSLVIVKLMGSGEYVVEHPNTEPLGHFGLALQDYLHATAPNRRFPDLVTQRLVKAAIAKAPAPYTTEELEALAAHCTAQEDAARKVERQMRKSEAALLLHSHVGQEFDALVTGSAPKGCWVRIMRPPAEGRLTGALPALRVGQSVRVKLVATSVERGFIDFVLVD